MRAHHVKARGVLVEGVEREQAREDLAAWGAKYKRSRGLVFFKMTFQNIYTSNTRILVRE